MSRTYLLGALHDATKREYTYRLSQKGTGYVNVIAQLVRDLDLNAWTYREGASRDVHVVEFSRRAVDDVTVESLADKRHYIRGYFDAEGGIPQDPEARFYVYFAQKDMQDLLELKSYLEEVGIETGSLHQPSAKQSPEYWRFYVASSSHEQFVDKIGSWHPRKLQVLREMRRSMP